MCSRKLYRCGCYNLCPHSTSPALGRERGFPSKKLMVASVKAKMLLFRALIFRSGQFLWLFFDRQMFLVTAMWLQCKGPLKGVPKTSWLFCFPYQRILYRSIWAFWFLPQLCFQSSKCFTILINDSSTVALTRNLHKGMTLELQIGIVECLWHRPLESIIFFIKMGQQRPLSVYFRSFQTNILQKNYRLQLDSNSDRRSRRRARWPLGHHHGPSIIFFICEILLLSSSLVLVLTQKASHLYFFFSFFSLIHVCPTFKADFLPSFLPYLENKGALFDEEVQ